MIKAIIKKFLTSKRLASYAADGIAKGFNGSKEDTRDEVAKYAVLAQEASRIANTLSGFLTDGRFDAEETDALREMLEPLFEKGLALI